MPMMISKFNRMIRNKVFWGIFAFAVSAAFVVTFAPQGSGGRNVPRKIQAGSMFGKDISVDEYRQARWFALNLQSTSYIPDEYKEQVADRTWTRLAALEQAEKLGLTVGVSEIQERIRNDQAFQVNGAYDRARYEAILGQVLKIDESTFVKYLRQSILLEKLYGSVDGAVWIPPMVLDLQLHHFTDRFDVEIFLVARDAFTPDITIGDDEIQTYYEENDELFRIPDQRAVDYVAFAFADSEPGEAITEEAIQGYYEANMENWSVPVTNVTPAAQLPGVTNVNTALQTNIVEQPLPVVAVREEIVTALTEARVQEAALRRAERFLNLMLPGDGTVISLPDAAAQLDVPVSHTEHFTESGTVPGLAGVGPDFNEEAFRLDPEDPQRAFSDPVKGQDAIYLLSYRSTIETHIPPLDDVRDEVVDLATRAAEQEAFTAHVADVREAMRAAAAKPESFADSVPATATSVTNTIFDVATIYYGAADASPYVEQIIPDIFEWETGEVSTPIVSPDGSLIVHVRSRTPADPQTRQGYRLEMYGQIARGFSSQNIRAWEENVLAMANVQREINE